MGRSGSLNDDLTYEEITQNVLKSEKLKTDECEESGNGNPVLNQI